VSKSRWYSVLLMVLVVSVLLSSCTPAAEPTAVPDVEPTEAPVVVQEYVVIALNWAHPYWTDIITGGEYFDEVMGDSVKVTFAGPQDPDFPGQIDAVIQQIAKKPAGMLVACFDPGVIPAINQAIDAGIPVGTFEADIPSVDNKRWFFVGVNPYKAGAAMGPELIKYAGESGKFIFSTNVGSSNSDEKVRGFNDFIADYPGWELVAMVTDEAQARQGADNIKPVLLANPDVTAIVGINAGSGAAAGTAVKELGLEDRITIVTQDRDDITLQLIDEGVIMSTVVTRSAVNTYFGLLALYPLM